MKAFIILALVAVAAADVSHLRTGEADAHIVSQDADVFPDQYKFGYETSNGISGQESGALKNQGREDEAIEAQGAFSYTSPEGQLVRVQYVANELGYQPQGDHLPTPPAPEPIPDYILKSLEYIRTHSKPENQKL